MIQGLEIFRQNPQGARSRAVEKPIILIGDQAVVLFLHEFSNCSIFFLSSRTVFNNSGSLGKAVIARSQTFAAKAGEPETREPAGTSWPIPLCAETMALSWIVGGPETPPCPASSTFRSRMLLPARPTCA